MFSFSDIICLFRTIRFLSGLINMTGDAPVINDRATGHYFCIGFEFFLNYIYYASNYLFRQ